MRSSPHLISLSCASLLFAAFTGVGAEPPQQSASRERVLERFKMANDEQILLPVVLQGKRYLFLLDTGASRSAYDLSLRSLLGKKVQTLPVKVAGQDMKIPLFQSPEGKVGKLALPANLYVMGIDLEKLREVSGEEIYGILGMDFLSKYTLRLDFDRGEVVFLRSVGTNPGKRIPVSFRSKCPYVPIDILGLDRPENFLIDIGNNDNGNLESRTFTTLVKRRKLEILGEALAETPSGRKTLRVGRVEELSIGGFRHSKLLFNEGHSSTLGLGYLSRYVVTLDFPNNAIYLKKGSQFDRTNIHLGDKSGLIIFRKKGQTVIGSVEEGSPAAKIGIKPQDVLLKIDGAKADEMSLSSLRRLLCTDGKKCRLLIRRGEKELEMTITLRNW